MSKKIYLDHQDKFKFSWRDKLMSRDNSRKTDQIESLTQQLRKYGMRSVLFQQNMALKLGVFPTDLKTADILNETGPITAGELARITGLSTGAVTALIDRLEKAGIVTRKKDPNDGRRVVIAPVLKRHQEILEHYQTLAQATKELCVDYDEKEMDLILTFTRNITMIMEEELEKLTVERDGGI